MTAAITDFTQFTELRSGAQSNDPAVLREVAGQFEALFLQTMLKNMREASLGDPLFGNGDQHDLYQGMMDEQLALEMASGKGVGLADMLVRQLGGQAADTKPLDTAIFDIPRRDAATPSRNWQTPEDFVADIWPHAKRAARALNVSPEGIVAHAALESGWGAHVMPNEEGRNSYNLFGVKTGSSWDGEQVNKQTLELRDGMLRPERANFRAYRDVASTFDDYVGLLGDNSRYSNVRNTGADSRQFAQALQDSGYATDPDYAEKLNTVLASPTMRRALAKVATGLNISSVAPITTQLSARNASISDSQ